MERKESKELLDDPLLEDDDEEESEKEEDEENDQEDKDNSDYVNTMIDELASLYKSGRLSDVTFIVGEAKEEIKAHKLVLASASPIFAQMVFPSELQKNQNCWASQLKFELPDVDAKSFKLLMQAIYTDKVNINVKTLPGALTVARRYCCEKLQLVCTDFLEEGVNENNACNMYNHAEEIAGDPNFGLNFILKKASKVFQTPGFLELFPDRLASILGHPQLQLREVVIFQKLMEWGEARVDAEDRDSDDVVLVRKKICDLVQCVRFPLMTLVEFTTYVSRTGILEDKDLLDLYSYIVCKQAGVPEEELPSLTWNINPRESSGFHFKWVKSGPKSTITEEGKKHVSNSSGYSCALADTGMPPNTGSYYWEFKVTKFQGGGWSCAAGIGTQMLNLSNYLSATAAGWAYFNQGCKAHQSGSANDLYGKKWGVVGDLVGCHYDSDEGNLSFYLNGENQGIAFKDIKSEVWPASHVNTGVGIIINEEVDTILTD